MKIWTYEEMAELEPCVDILEEHIDDIQGIAKQMIETCVLNGGIGLAAPQVGINGNFFIYSPDAKEFHIVINPTWVPLEKKKTKSIEQCLSLDRSEFYYVERYKYISVKYYSISPDTKKLVEVKRRMQKDEAVVFQHEADHLKGITLIDSGVKISE